MRLKASAVKVVAITLMPAMPGIRMSSSLRVGANTDAIRSRNSSGSTKLKKAALGLRQNSLRSKRNCSQARRRGAHSVAVLGGQLEVDVLERRPRDLEPLEPLAAGERVAGQAVQQLGRVVGLELHAAAVGQVGDAVARAAGAELGGRALGHDPAVLDDRHAVGQRLGLLEVVGGEQHRLAELACSRAHHVPGGRAARPGRSRWWARRGRSARGRRPAPAPGRAAAAGRRTARPCGRRPSPRGPPARSSRRRRAGAGRPSRSAPPPRGRSRGVEAAALEHDPDPLAAARRSRTLGVVAEHARPRRRVRSR